jgi:hypothetical protein
MEIRLLVNSATEMAPGFFLYVVTETWVQVVLLAGNGSVSCVYLGTRLGSKWDHLETQTVTLGVFT